MPALDEPKLTDFDFAKDFFFISLRVRSSNLTVSKIRVPLLVVSNCLISSSWGFSKISLTTVVYFLKFGVILQNSEISKNKMVLTQSDPMSPRSSQRIGGARPSSHS